MFEGKTALVVGGGRGIGAAAARLLACEGALVAVSYLRNRESAEAAAEEVREAGGRIELFQSDAHVGEQVRELVRKAYALAGRLDIVVYSAPARGTMRPLEELSWEEFIQPAHTTLRASYELARAAIPLLKERLAGRMVFVTSGWAKNPTMPGLCGLNAGFGAEVSFVKALAREVGPLGITVNAVAPGMVDTELSARMPPEVRGRVAGMTPLGRIATPDDVAGVIGFLASDASAFMTGTYLPVNGGISIE
ncbi:MAG TPA: SDR family oxidoreductase [Spirochaetia bacterium]|nr:SDR family oxidoreductase [Spirochaetia bacterium]